MKVTFLAISVTFLATWKEEREGREDIDWYEQRTTVQIIDSAIEIKSDTSGKKRESGDVNIIKGD